MSITKTILVSVTCDHESVCLEAHRVEVAPPVVVDSTVEARARMLAARKGWTITKDGDYCPAHPPPPPRDDGPDGGVPAMPTGDAPPSLSAEAEPELVLAQ